MNEMLTASKVYKTYQEGTLSTPVLQGVDFVLHEAEMVALLGASGSGKSTLLHLLGGLDSPTSGEIILNNQRLSGLNANQLARLRNRYLGFVYQFHHLLPELTALENVMLPALIAGKPKHEAQQKATYLLAEVGLQARLGHKPSELSGGERQRVAIARGLVNDPLCVLMDEPTGNLDRATSDTIIDLFVKLNSRHKTAFLLVTHDGVLAQRMSRIVKISDGICHED